MQLARERKGNGLEVGECQPYHCTAIFSADEQSLSPVFLSRGTGIGQHATVPMSGKYGDWTDRSPVLLWLLTFVSGWVEEKRQNLARYFQIAFPALQSLAWRRRPKPP
jgi:hypothetical protein